MPARLVASLAPYLTQTDPDIVPEIHSGFRVILDDSQDISDRFGSGISRTYDARSAFSSASFPVDKPFTLDSGRHVIQWEIAWNGKYIIAFRGEITTQGQQYYRRADTLQAAGILRRLEVGLDVAMGFYNLNAEAAIDPAGEIPFGYEQIPISTDADIIIKILETYGIENNTSSWFHHIEADYDWKPAMLYPIIWDPGVPGWQIVQELDKATSYRTFDYPNGAVYRLAVQGGTSERAVHNFEQGVDLLDCSVDRTYDVYNQVVVTGANLEEPELDNQGNEVDVVTGTAPVGDPVTSDYIPNPPRIRTNRDISSQYIETIPDAERLAHIYLGILKDPIETITIKTFASPDITVGTPVHVTSAAQELNVTGFVVTDTIQGGTVPQSTLVLAAALDAVPIGNRPPIPGMIINLFLEYVVLPEG